MQYEEQVIQAGFEIVDVQPTAKGDFALVVNDELGIEEHIVPLDTWADYIHQKYLANTKHSQATQR